MPPTSRNYEPLFYRLTVGMLVLFCLWFVLPTHNVEVQMAKHLPLWLAWTNLLFLPFLLAVAAGSSHIPLPIRSFFLALALCSLLILEFSLRRYLWLSAAALALFLLEVYWIIPKWNSKFRARDVQAQ
jgi:hypothetical protein